jgi:lambda repressor-like predicted transcriptional regulator
VEVVQLYSNLLPGPETMVQLRVKAAATARSRDRLPCRQSQVRLDPHQANALAVAYRAGKAIKELAAWFGIHRATVTAVLQRLGVELGQSGLSDAQVAEACRLYPDGWSLARLAERYDVTDMTVRRYLLLAGVVMRSPHDRPGRSA